MQGKNRQELIVGNKCTRSFRSQANYLKKNGEELYSRIFDWYFSQYGKKEIDGVNKFLNLEDFWQSMGVYEMINKIKNNVKRTLDIGYKINYRTFKEPLQQNAIEFSLQNPWAVQYMRGFTDLHLSDNPVSITETTKNAVIGKLREGVENNMSYGQVAKEIEKLDNFIFSRNRAKLIAVREIGKAYEYGNFIPMLQAHDAGLEVRKQRNTVKDDRVTQECNHNENQDRVPFLYTYIYDNDDIAPRSGNPRCRCAMNRDIS